MTVSDDDIASMLTEELLQRRTTVMFLRNGGATWDAIAKHTGVSIATCRKDYAVVCRDINAEQPANVVARHRAVVYDIQRANYAKMMQGDRHAARTILRALHHEMILLGVAAPTKVLAEISNQDFANEAAKLLTKIAQLDPDTLKELERAAHPEDPATAVLDVEEVAAEPDPVTRDDPGPGTGADDGTRTQSVHADVPGGDKGTDVATTEPAGGVEAAVFDIPDDLDGWSNI